MKIQQPFAPAVIKRGFFDAKPKTSSKAGVQENFSVGGIDI